MNTNLIRQMQNYVAETCIGASALRNQGDKGLIEASRRFFKKINLPEIPTDPIRFKAWLDEKTMQLLNDFPTKAQNFGAARKALNLFLRSTVYNIHLNRAHNLDPLLPILELPLDSYAAKHLIIKGFGVKKLPRWPGLKSLSEADHNEYQKAARSLSLDRGLQRVDLDAFFFREDTNSE